MDAEIHVHFFPGESHSSLAFKFAESPIIFLMIMEVKRFCYPGLNVYFVLENEFYSEDRRKHFLRRNMDLG